MPELYGREQHGVRTEMGGAGISTGAGGRRQKGVIVGRADPNATEYEANAVRQLTLRSDIDRYFGAESELGVQLEAASYNGATRQDLHGVAPEEVSVTEEQVASGSDTLDSAPIIESASDTVVEGPDPDATDGSTMEFDVNFVYESLPTAPSGDAETVNINPHTGEVEAPTDDDYTISYKHLDWDTALEAAAEVITVGEVGGIFVASEAASVAETLSGIVDEDHESATAIRQDYRLGFGLALAQPNATSEDGTAMVDPAEYSDNYDNDALFVLGGARLDPASTDAQNASDAPLTSGSANTPATVAGGVFGKMLGNQMTSPIYEDTLTGYGDAALAQAYDRDAAQSLRDAGVIPMVDPSRTAADAIEIGGNTSTSTATDYVRDFHRLTIKDNVNLNFRNLAEGARSEILVTGPDGVIQETGELGRNIFRQLAERGVVVGAEEGEGGQNATSAIGRTQPAESAGTPTQGENAQGGDGEAPFSVEVTRGDTDELVLEYEFVPVPIVKQVSLYGTVRDSVPISESGSGTGGTAA